MLTFTDLPQERHSIHQSRMPPEDFFKSRKIKIAVSVTQSISITINSEKSQNVGKVLDKQKNIII